MTSEFDGLGLSPEFIAHIEEVGRRCEARQAAKDEREAAEKANELGLTGREAENFKARLVTSLNAGRRAARDRVLAVVESPEGKARPKAALDVALRSDLTAEQAIAKLAATPVEEDEAAAAARKILEA